MPVGSKLIALLSTSFPLRPFTVFRLARYSWHPFAVLPSAAIFHGRLHSVFNRPKLGFWSGAANQFHSQPVINEGSGEAATSFSDSKNSHPWPEWSKLADLLVEKGNSDCCINCGDDDDSFLVDGCLPEEFLKAAEACLGFARGRPDILRLLAKKNIEALVLNGSPFLFKNGENSARRMKIFLTGEGSSELELEKAQTIDIMRYLLSYVYGHLSSSDDDNVKSDELVERSVRKLLCELFNLSGTVWKPKSVDATLAELPLSNEQLSGHPEQYFEMRSGDGVYPKIPGRSSAASENQSNTSCNFTDKEYEKSIFNQKQGPEEAPSSQTVGGRSTLNCDFITNPAQPSTSALNNNVESWNRVQTSSTSNAQLSNETSAPYGYTNSGQPPCHLGNNYNTYYGGCTGKPTQSTGNLWTNGSTTYGGSTAKSSTPSGNSWNERRSTSYNGYDVNSTPRSINPSSNSSTFYGGPSANSSLPPSNSWNNYNTSFAGHNVSSAQPSGTLRSNDNSPYGGSTVNSSQPPPSGSWTNNYNTANSTQPSSHSWSNNNSSYGESTPNSSQPPSSYQGNYSTQYGDSSNTYSTSSSGFNEKLKHPSTNSYSASTGYSPQPPINSWNSYNTPYGKNVMKSTQPSSNYWSNNNTSFGGPTANSSQPPSNSWNSHNTNTAYSTEPSTSSRNSDNSYVAFNADSYRRYPPNSNPSSSYPWNNSRESFSSGIPQASSGLPSHAQTQNAGNLNYGYSGKSLEGSCVTEPDPLDMSEEAKAERWFRRAAQIKDISELSQIPDEDFPQIMPMRKGVNRFVVSKRKTPLERRLASQQYKRSLPVVSSEPDKEPESGEKEIQPFSD